MRFERWLLLEIVLAVGCSGAGKDGADSADTTTSTPSATSVTSPTPTSTATATTTPSTPTTTASTTPTTVSTTTTTSTATTTPTTTTTTTTTVPTTTTTVDGCDGAGGVPLLDSRGVWSGFVTCPDGSVNRPEAVTCDPDPGLPACTGAGGWYDECTSDAECIASPFGACSEGAGLYGACGCTYTCETDADCGSGDVCVCGGTFGDVESWSHCVDARDCAVDADCASGECGYSVFEQYEDCGWSGFAERVGCRDPSDACRAPGDCPGRDCALPPVDLGPYASESWACREPVAICGRPLHVQGADRVAAVCDRPDWHADTDALGVDSALAAHWEAIGALEHASVASFAQATLQLMALGAPPFLLSDTQLAAADEVEHARLAFGLAVAYGGRGGPGPLSMQGVGLAVDRWSVIEGLVRDAAVGETVAACEAVAAAGPCQVGAVRSVLTRIGADEARHAKLGWRTLAWALGGADEATLARAEAVLEHTICELLERSTDSVHRPEAGVLGGVALIEVRHEAVRAVVRPAWAALVASRSASRAA
jgi:hypothetical protein